MSTGMALTLSLFFLALNGFFVAAEFAIVAAKRHRLEEKAEEGSMAARAAMHATKELSFTLAGTQLGITLCTLALGALAEPAVASLLMPLFHALGIPDALAHTVALVVAVALVVFLHMVVGEMAPKSWAISHPESSAMAVAIPFRAFAWLMRPVIWLMNELANTLLRLGGIDPVSETGGAQTPAELQLLLSQSHEHGVLGDDDHQILTGALRLEELTVADVMIPIAQAVHIPTTATVSDAEERSRESGRSRLLVIDEKLRIRGIVHIRDILTATANSSRHRKVTEFLQPVPSLTTSMPLIDAVSAMRQRRAQLALVRTQNGAIVGLTSMEDMLEQILGEFDDESDESKVTL